MFLWQYSPLIRLYGYRLPPPRYVGEIAFVQIINGFDYVLAICMCTQELHLHFCWPFNLGFPDGSTWYRSRNFIQQNLLKKPTIYQLI